MNKRLSVRVILCVALIVLGCGSGEDILQQNPPPNPPGQLPPSGTDLTDEQRMTVLNECGTFIDALGDFKSDAAQQVIASYLKTRTEFKDAGVQLGNVWATFHDGRMAIIVPSYLSEPAFSETDAGGRISSIAGSGRLNVPGARYGRSQTIPLSKKGILFNGLGSAFMDGRVYLEALFNKSGADYNLERKDATIDNLKAVNDEAIIYILTHGGVGFTFSGLIPTPKFSLWTSDLVSKAKDEQYKTDLDNGALSYVYGLQNLSQPNEWHYGITQEFVKKYMSFADDAIVYLDACSSMSEEAKAFSEQVLDKCKNKMGTYVGWTKPMSGLTYIPTHRYIFDRMIGSDDASPTQQDPPQRPFDFESVHKDMLTYPEVFDLGVSRAHGGRLAYNSRRNSEVLLTPSISYIIMSDYENKMIIHGLFGDGPQDKGSVSINGQLARIELWSKNLIICEIDQEGSASSGDVIVAFNGHHSNKVPLTSWTIPLTVTRDVAGVKTEAKLTLKLRADVHRYRTIPNADPIVERADSLGLGDEQGMFGFGWPFSKASTGTYSVGGRREASCELGGCQVSETQTSQDKGGDLPYDYDVVTPGLKYGAWYRWSRDLKRLRVGVLISVPNVTTDYTLTYRSCDGANPKDQHHSASEDIVITVPSAEHEMIELEFDENFKIAEGNKPKTQTFPWSLCNTTVSWTTRVQWPGVEAKDAPTSETAARGFK